MNQGYFEKLEDELRRAVPLATAGTVRVGSGASWRRPRLGTLAVALGAVISVLVAALALTLVHARRPHSEKRPAVSRPHRHFRIPVGENIYPLGAVATRTQLLANFAVLRRPQNARDRSWRPVCSCGGAARQFYGLTRYSQNLPDRNRVFLDLEQFIQPGQLNMAAGSYVLNLDLVSPNGNTSGAAFGPNTGYLVFPVPNRGPDNTHGVPQTNDWASIIPDGVTTVRWIFACYRGTRLPCAAGSQHTYTVPVIQNVAATSIPKSGNCQGCAQPVQVQWLNGHGNIVASFGPRHGNLSAPPFVKGELGTHGLDVLNSDGIATARLGGSSTQAIATLSSLLGPTAQTSVPTRSCGINRESVWTSPAVAEPLTIFQRAGRFVGYRYGAPAFEIGLDTGPGATLRTARGLTIGDTIGLLRQLYGHQVTTRVSNGNGSWKARTNTGTIGGAVLPIRYPLKSISARNPIVTIEAGDTGC